MSHYQSLIDDAVASVNALRGFIILRDASTNTFEYAAMQNFDPEDFRDIDSDQMFLDLLADPEPRLTNNSIKDKYRPPGVIAFTNLMHIMIVPLKKDGAIYGLLLCDRFVKQGLFTQDDLARVVSLVDQFQETP